MNKLTLEHLAPYLPYNLQILNGWRDIKTLNYSHLDDEGNGFINHVMPILEPISSITLEWFQNNIDEGIEDFRINCEPDHNHFSVEVCDKILGWSALSYEEYQLFFKHHIDVFGLIDRGLAIDKTKVKEETR